MTDTPNTRALAAASWLRTRADQHISIGIVLAADVTRQPSDVEEQFVKAFVTWNIAETFERIASDGD